MKNIYGFYVLRETVEEYANYYVKERYFLDIDEAKKALKKSYQKLYKHFDKKEVGGIAACPRAYASFDDQRGFYYQIWWYETPYKGEILSRDFEDRGKLID